MKGLKVVYVLAQGHSGSTLADAILGTHQSFVSSGELRYLGWQIYRTINVEPTVERQDICSCGRDWRNCAFWVSVDKDLKESRGQSIVEDPLGFDMQYFGSFSYMDQAPGQRRFWQRAAAYLSRLWLERGGSLELLLLLFPRLQRQLVNNWALYASMAKVARKQVIVDSSKNLLIALLLQRYRPDDVCLVFLRRNPLGVASSTKKIAQLTGAPFCIDDCVRAHRLFSNRVAKYKRLIRPLKYVDISYEEMVVSPGKFVSEVAAALDLPSATSTDGDFWIDPSMHHMVAGNPMRYRGRQPVKLDDSWRSALTPEETAEMELRL